MNRSVFFFFQAEDGIRDLTVTGVQTCALPILGPTGPIYSYGRIRRVLMIVARERSYSKLIVELDEPLRLAAKESRLISAVSRSYLDGLPKLASLGRVPVVFAIAASWILGCGEDDPRLFSENDEAYLGFGGIHITP